MRRSPRLILALAMVAIGLVSYYGMRQENPVTGELQHISLTPQQEVALGLEAAPQMAEQMGGMHPDDQVQQYVDEVGRKIVEQSQAKEGPYEYEFHVLADPETVNAFALPGGQIFITSALLGRLENEHQLAGVLGHEVGHVVGRHASEHIAKGQLAQILVGAAGVAASDPDNPYSGQRAAAIASMVAQVVTLRYGRKDELESDTLGVDFMSQADYNPRSMIQVMDILEEASAGRARGPEWMQTHPDPGNRREQIASRIEQKYPDVEQEFDAERDPKFQLIQQRLRTRIASY